MKQAEVLVIGYKTIDNFKEFIYLLTLVVIIYLLIYLLILF